MKIHKNQKRGLCVIWWGSDEGAKGYCDKHYQEIQKRKYGESLNTKRKERFAKVCGEPANARQLCGKHYQAWKRKGNFRIRKLTPKSCFRLMGFTDEDYYKARKALEDKFYNGKDRSNSQMYKMAGNSIVVDVLEGILKNLIN